MLTKVLVVEWNAPADLAGLDLEESSSQNYFLIKTVMILDATSSGCSCMASSSSAQFTASGLWQLWKDFIMMCTPRRTSPRWRRSQILFQHENLWISPMKFQILMNLNYKSCLQNLMTLQSFQRCGFGGRNNSNQMIGKLCTGQRLLDLASEILHLSLDLDVQNDLGHLDLTAKLPHLKLLVWTYQLRMLLCNQSMFLVVMLLPMNLELPSMTFLMNTHLVIHILKPQKASDPETWNTTWSGSNNFNKMWP